MAAISRIAAAEMIVAMQDYRVYVIGPDGHVVQRHDLWCAKEGDAKERAEQ
jgi:hypothetical protein